MYCIIECSFGRHTAMSTHVEMLGISRNGKQSFIVQIPLFCLTHVITEHNLQVDRYMFYCEMRLQYIYIINISSTPPPPSALLGSHHTFKLHLSLNCSKIAYCNIILIIDGKYVLNKQLYLYSAFPFHVLVYQQFWLLQPSGLRCLVQSMARTYTGVMGSKPIAGMADLHNLVKLLMNCIINQLYSWKN